MLNLLDWNKPLMVNNVMYANSEAAYAALQDYEGEIEISLNVPSTVTQPEPEQKKIEKEVNEELQQEYLFTLPTWLAKSNNCPNELKGKILTKTPKAVEVSATGLVEPSINCRICGRPLTNPVSQAIGVGPDCAAKWGVPYDSNDMNSAVAAGKKLQEKLFKMWLPISRVKIEVTK